MKSLTLPAMLDQLELVTEFINKELEQAGCPMKAQMQIDIAVEEIFVNIAHYAYAPGTGEVTVRCMVERGEATVQFEDGGKPYDPLQKADPDVTLDIAEREVGGLGIYMVKKSMDAISYAYQDGKNILTLKKKI